MDNYVGPSSLLRNILVNCEPKVLGLEPQLPSLPFTLTKEGLGFLKEEHKAFKNFLKLPVLPPHSASCVSQILNYVLDSLCSLVVSLFVPTNRLSVLRLKRLDIATLDEVFQDP